MSDDQHGFTLIETLIAFVILSLALVMATQTVALATRSIARSREDRDIQTVLDHVDRDLLASAATSQPFGGNDSSIRWEARRFPMSGDQQRPRFVVITVTVSSGRSLKFLRFEVSTHGARE